MYDITDKDSFNNIRNWIKQVEANVDSNICKVLVGNNCHKPDRKVTEEEGKKLADYFNMSFFETSFKTNQNVKEVFDFLAREILKKEIIKAQNNKKIKDKKVTKKNSNAKCIIF